MPQKRLKKKNHCLVLSIKMVQHNDLVDEKSKELGKTYKDNTKFKAYSKAMNKVNKENKM